MKIAAISDLHGDLPAIPKCDVLLVAGDICPLADHSQWAQSQFLTHEFAKWREGLNVKSVIYIAGNHDWIFERDRTGAQRWKERLQADRSPGESYYLQDNYCIFDNLKIYGTPWQPRFFDWAFNLDEPELALKFAEIPADTDILISHGPPLGYGDRSSHSNRPCGSPSLLAAIDRVKPRLCVFGHIHEGAVNGNGMEPSSRMSRTWIARIVRFMRRWCLTYKRERRVSFTACTQIGYTKVNRRRARKSTLDWTPFQL